MFNLVSLFFLSILLAGSLPSPIARSQTEDSPFPAVIHRAMDQSLDDEASLNQKINQTDLGSISPGDERAVFLFARGLNKFAKDPVAAAKDFEAASKMVSKNSPLSPLVAIYLGRATLTPRNARSILTKLKLMTKGSSKASYWRPEQFFLMIEILVAMKQDGLLAKTWSEMEARVRPAQRSDELAEKVAKYIEAQKISQKSELIPVVESLAASYPHSETARWAFQKLQQLTCARKTPYIYSLTLISRLASNTNLDEGLKSFLIELTKGPVRTISGQIKHFDDLERIDYLIQIRFLNEAMKLLEEQLESVSQSQSTDGRLKLARIMNAMGQIQVRQGDFEGAAKTWSRFLETFANQVDWRPATENLADCLARLRIHGAAAKLYETLAQAPSSDPVLKWHHFWNTYLAGDYKGALNLLDKVGYVPQRDRGIDGGLDYWRARILEKLGQKNEADALYRKILTANGENFYSIVILAKKPLLTEASKSSQFSGKPVSYEADSEGFLPADNNTVTPSDNDKDHDYEAFSSEVDIKATLALKNWGYPQIARRIFRLLPSVRQRSGQNSWTESFRLALDLRDFAYGLKAPSIPDSPLRLIPTSNVELESHIAEHNADWKLLYPYAYRDVLDVMAQSSGVDPFLVLGVMRAESVYDLDARSIVGARGLMQIMPFTAIRIARVMNDSRFTLKDLPRPELNIGYGAFYLKMLLDYYKGNPFLAIAAYNGGPVSVDRWVSRFGDLEIDEFVETIPFRETRRYVKTVFKNYNQYKNIWQQSRALTTLPEVPHISPGIEIF